MQLANAGSKKYKHPATTYKSWLSGQLGVILGLCLLALVAISFASLATWSVLDPSFSNANGNIVQNAGGYLGASLSDILMQFFGLASTLALVPPAIWGWLKLIQKPIGYFKKRLIAWPVAMASASAAFGCLPVFETWPLPAGMGGITGDLVLAIPRMIIGEYPSHIFAIIFFTLFIIPAIGFTLYAAGLVNRPPKTDPNGFNVDPETGEILENSGSISAGLLAGFIGTIGAVSHWALTFQAMRKRKSQNAAPTHHDTQQASIVIQKEEVNPAPQQEDPYLQSGAQFKSQKTGFLKRLTNAYDKLTEPADDGLSEFHNPSAQHQNIDHHSLDQFSQQSQLEPGFQPLDQDPTFADTQYGAAELITAPEMAPTYGEEVYGNAPDLQETHPSIAPQTTSRIVQQQPIAPTAAPVQNARVSRQPQQKSNVGGFILPDIDFLAEHKSIVKDATLSAEALEANARLLESVLEDFGVKGEIIQVHPGPVVTLYELEPAPGIKSSRVVGLADDIARSMSAIAARVAVIPGRNAIGIELPNHIRETVYLRETFASKAYESTKAKLPLVLGKDIGGKPVIADLAKMPHLLVAGTTGSGKSVAMNTMILSILYKLDPTQVKMIMIDPKMLELSIYEGIPHLLTPVVTDPKKAVVALKWTVREMEDRYKKMSKVGVRNIDGFNQRVEQAKLKGEPISRTIQTGFDRDTGEAIYETEQLNLEPMPFIVVLIDEMADLMMVAGKDIEGTIQRLAQMARAAGIHVIMATQRPSVDVITGTIKANFPTRISFQVTSKIDSRTILGEQGAEQLLGMGDMLYMAGGGRTQRVHGPFVADEEVEAIVKHLKTQGVPQYLEAVTEDIEEEGAEGSAPAGTDKLSESNDIYDQAVAVVLRDRKVSTSYIQRRLGIGYNRAATLIERMEDEKLISAANHAGKREILVPDENETF